MPRRISKQAYNYVLEVIHERGHMSTDDLIDIVEPHYDFDPRAARKREIRRFVGQLARKQRDDLGVRTMFLEKTKSEIVDVGRCKDLERVSLVTDQLRSQAAGIYKSYRKAAKRRLEIAGQVSLFDEHKLIRELVRM